MSRPENRKNRKDLKEQMYQLEEDRLTFSFYKYWSIEKPFDIRDSLFKDLETLGVKGRIYLSYEGVNGQVSVVKSNLEKLKAYTETIDFLKGIRFNFAIEDDGKSFFVLKIKVREKIVADGLDENLDLDQNGKHIGAIEFNQLTNKNETILIDMRNHYESEVGHFKGAMLPEAATFRDLLPEVLEKLEGKEEKEIVMYCTGGIRCEKASAFLKNKGFEKVYQLDGGIIDYARQVKDLEIENKFKGKNFVFDERLGERISEDVIAHCHQCGTKSDRHVNCENDACHLLFIQCDTCATEFENCCSIKCKEFNKLPKAEQKSQRKDQTFNGSKFSKGRYYLANDGKFLQ